MAPVSPVSVSSSRVRALVAGVALGVLAGVVVPGAVLAHGGGEVGDPGADVGRGDAHG